MPISMTWDAELPHTIHSVFHGNWTWDEFAVISRQIRQLVADEKIQTNTNFDVYVIADFRDSKLLPDRAISYFRNTIEGSATPFKLAAIIVKGTFIERMAELFVKLYVKAQGRIQLVRSVEEARTLIAKTIASQTNSAS